MVLLLSALACALAIALPEAAIEPFRTAARSAAATPMRAALVLASVTLVVLVTNVFVQQPNAWDERGLLAAAPVIASRGFRGFSEPIRATPGSARSTSCRPSCTRPYGRSAGKT